MSKSEAPILASVDEFIALRGEGRSDEALEAGHILEGQWVEAARSENTDATRALCEYADLLKDTGNREDAERVYREVTAILEGKELPELKARAFTGLALLLDEDQRPEEAHDAYMEAILASEASENPNAPQIATLANNLAIICKEMGRMPDAEALYLKAIGIYKAQHPKGHPDTATAMNNLGVFYLQTGDLQNAESLHIKALIMRQNECHPSDPDIAQSYSNLAAVYHLRGWLDKAEAFYQKALAALNYSKNPPVGERETTIRNYVGLLRMMGNDALAAKLETRI